MPTPRSTTRPIWTFALATQRRPAHASNPVMPRHIQPSRRRQTFEVLTRFRAQDERAKADGERGSRERVHFMLAAFLRAVGIASEDGTPRSGSSLTTSAVSRHTFSVQAAGAGSHKPKSRRRRPWHDRRISSMSTLCAQSVSLHHDGVAHQTSLRSRRTMMTRANSLRAREAGSLISLPVTHDHDPHKHPRTGATVMTAVVGYGGRTRRN